MPEMKWEFQVEKVKLWWNTGTSEPVCQEPGAQILTFTIQ